MRENCTDTMDCPENVLHSSLTCTLDPPYMNLLLYDMLGVDYTQFHWTIVDWYFLADVVHILDGAFLEQANMNRVDLVFSFKLYYGKLLKLNIKSLPY